jgi:ABC-type multidrug transport system ATPase subunit
MLPHLIVPLQVSKLLKELGLESCANTRAGNALIKGLSGGQKRRLSLGLALAKRPSIIMLDEPTSGLDAAGAAAIMKMMQKVAIDLNAAVLCTIHQPSAKVFEGFDKTLILSGGRLAYVGPASEMATYLGSIGLPVPPATNPADFMLDVVNKDFVSEEEVEKVHGCRHHRSRLATLCLRGVCAQTS